MVNFFKVLAAVVFLIIITTAIIVVITKEMPPLGLLPIYLVMLMFVMTILLSALINDNTASFITMGVSEFSMLIVFTIVLYDIKKKH